MFVATSDELEEQVRGVLVKGDVADSVNDEQAVAAEFREFMGKLPSGVGFLQPGYPSGSGVEEDPVAGFGRFDASTQGQMGITGAGVIRAEYSMPRGPLIIAVGATDIAVGGR